MNLIHHPVLMVLAAYSSFALMDDIIDCGEWQQTLQSRSVGGESLLSVQTVLQCRLLCLLHPLCVGVDFMPAGGGQKCYLQFTPHASVTSTNQSTHYDLRAACTPEAVCGWWTPGDQTANYIDWQCVHHVASEQRCKMMCANLANCDGIRFAATSHDGCCCALYHQHDGGNGDTHSTVAVTRLDVRKPCKEACIPNCYACDGGSGTCYNGGCRRHHALTGSGKCLGVCENQQLRVHYAGQRRHTLDGLPCIGWSVQSHSRFADQHFPDGSVHAAGSFCRNPNFSRTAPWCYTDVTDAVWSYCNVPKCDADEMVEYRELSTGVTESHIVIKAKLTMIVVIIVGSIFIICLILLARHVLSLPPDRILFRDSTPTASVRTSVTAAK